MKIKNKIENKLNKIACKLNFHVPNPETIHQYLKSDGTIEREALCQDCGQAIYNTEKIKINKIKRQNK